MFDGRECGTKLTQQESRPFAVWSIESNPCYDLAMKEKLTWKEIEERYWHQWVQLVDFDWPDTEPWPLTAVVRVHSADKREFNKLAAKDRPNSTARLYVDGIAALYRISDKEAQAILHGSR
jgi:hypothetical protein